MIYQRRSITSYVRLLSTNYGVNWNYSFEPDYNTFQMTSISSGSHVYIISKYLPTGGFVISYSSDGGLTFSNASGLTGQQGSDPQITTDSSGQYVYAIWQEDTSNNIKLFYSNDYGHSFADIGFNFGITRLQEQTLQQILPDSTYL